MATVSADRGPWPLTEIQEAVLRLARVHQAGSANLHCCLPLAADLDLGSLASAVTALVERHAALRTRVIRAGGELRQLVEPPDVVPLPRKDLRPFTARERAAELERILAEQRTANVDPERVPPVRFLLVTVDPEVTLLSVTVHQAVADRWSLTVLARDLGLLYDTYARGRAMTLPPLAPVAWGRTVTTAVRPARQAGDPRRRRAAGDPLDRTDQPPDRPDLRPPLARAVARGRLAAVEARAARRLASRFAMPLSTVLLTAAALLVAVSVGRDELVVLTEAPHRRPADLADLVAPLTGRIAVPVRWSAGTSLAELLVDVDRAVAAPANPDDPTGTDAAGPAPVLIQTEPTVPVAASTLFRADWPELLSRARATRAAPLPFAQHWLFTPATEHIDYVIDYDPDLVDGGTLDRLVGALRAVVRSGAVAPQRAVTELVPALPPPPGAAAPPR